MKPPKKPRVSIRDIARTAGLSKTAVGYALQNLPRVSPATRQRVLRIAKKLGYAPDARITSWMAQVREAQAKDLLPLAWLHTESEKNQWHTEGYLSPYWEGAVERASELGYRLDDIWTRQPGMTMRRIAQILTQRGIEGVIVTHPARHVRLNWEHLAGVCLEGALLAPPLHRIKTDLNFNLQLALKALRRLGYRRIGICLTEQVDSFSHHVIRSSAHYFRANLPPAEQVAPLFHPYELPETAKGRQVAEWLQREKPEVIVGHDNHLVAWAKASGYRVPEDIGIVHLAIDDDVSDWAGVYSNRREIGRAAVEVVVSLIQNRQFGTPALPRTTLIQGRWQPGKTLRPSC